jgi:hypothetical protein
MNLKILNEIPAWNEENSFVSLFNKDFSYVEETQA